MSITYIVAIILSITAFSLIIYFTTKQQPCKPNCTGKKCGDDDGCNGKCNNCPSGPKCKNTSDCLPKQICNTTTGICELSCKYTKCPSGQTCNTKTGKCEPETKRGPPTPEQLKQVKDDVTAFSNVLGGKPVIIFVNYTKETVVARLGSGTGLIPCSIGDPCQWGNNQGRSKVHKIGSEVTASDFDNGINQSYQILEPNYSWVITIPTTNGMMDFRNGSPDNTGKFLDGAQNLYFAYGFTGKYYGTKDKSGKMSTTLYDTLDDALKQNEPYQIFPQCLSNLDNWDLAVGNQTQLEMDLSHKPDNNTTQTDISSVNGVSKALYHAMYDIKGNDVVCNYKGNNQNYLFCDYDRKNCDFPDYIKDNGEYKIILDENNEPYNCLQPGLACSKYREDNGLSSIWGKDLDDKFTYTDSYGTTWTKDGCVDKTAGCKKDGETLTYMGLPLSGGSCEIMNASNLSVGNANWVTGSKPPENIDSDEIWKKYNVCRDYNNFGSTSDRLRICKYGKETQQRCPILGNGSCLDEDGTGSKDSWASEVMQKFCENCHNDTCSSYCQSYDDYWGTMSCPLDKLANVVVITY